jgi:hypothetical protein
LTNFSTSSVIFTNNATKTITIKGDTNNRTISNDNKRYLYSGGVYASGTFTMSGGIGGGE